MKYCLSKLISSCVMIGVLAFVSINSAIAAPTSSTKPLWKSGLYGGGMPSNTDPTTSSVLFEILNNKKTVKGFGGFFPITCYYDDGTESTKSENISRTTSPTFTISRNDKNQRKTFEYTDDFGVKWDVAVSMKWNRIKQSFKVHLSVLIPKEELGDNYCKADLTFAQKAVRLRALE